MRIVILLLSLVASAHTLSGLQGRLGVASLPLAKQYRDWLVSVDPIMTAAEKRLFLSLRKDYQRDAFVRKFWLVRDPYPQTGRNELRERYEERSRVALADYGSLEDDRAKILLTHGPPAREIQVRCTTTRIPAVIWSYHGSDIVDFSFALIFLRARGGTAPARIWRPGGLGAIQGVVSQARRCINGALLDDVVGSVIQAGQNYDITLSRVLVKPRPKSLEWVAAFRADTTDIPDGAEVFPAEMETSFLGRHQSRTVLQGRVLIDAQDATVSDLAGYRSRDFLLFGEVLRDGQLFEGFRYKYGFPDNETEMLDLTFRRYLRPGDYTLLLKVEDLNGETFFGSESTLSVPRLDNEYEEARGLDSESARLLKEATASATGGTALRIVPPADWIQTGLVRFDTLVVGSEVDRVAFFLDDRALRTKNNPPFNVEIDLGSFPRLHTLRADALDASGNVLAWDEIEVNAGGQRFSVRLIEPRRGGRYTESLVARADVRAPEGATLERLELFVGEKPVATLYQPPFVQEIAVPRGGSLSYVRAVAYLTDGNSTEDTVFINTPDQFEQIEVQFVELFASVIDRSGRPVQGLGREEFLIEEDGVDQVIARFELVSDLPIYVAVLIDNSASMRGSLQTMRGAALRFFEAAIDSKDRAAVITFNRFPHLAVKLTNDLQLLGGGLAGLTAEGQTALYDSLMFALYYLTGVSGQRALLLLSDGKDEVSRFSFQETLEYAQRAGVTIFTVGLGISDGNARKKLSRIADATGGRSYFIREVREIDLVYETIERELRSQYYIAYQSTNTARDDSFRKIDVVIRQPGLEIKTMSGYYP